MNSWKYFLSPKILNENLEPQETSRTQQMASCPVDSSSSSSFPEKVIFESISHTTTRLYASKLILITSGHVITLIKKNPCCCSDDVSCEDLLWRRLGWFSFLYNQILFVRRFYFCRVVMMDLFHVGVGVKVSARHHVCVNMINIPPKNLSLKMKSHVLRGPRMQTHW